MTAFHPSKPPEARRGGEAVPFLSPIDGSSTKYVGLAIDFNLAFQPEGLTLGDLADITYYTKKGSSTSALDWSIRIYTQPTVGGTWYGYRFDGKTPNAADTDWHLWDADSSGWFTAGQVASPKSSLSFTKSLSELASDSTYGSLSLLYMVLVAGSSTNTQSILNSLDGITITRANGDQVKIDLVPEPGTFALLFGGLGVLRLLHSRRRSG